MPLDKYYLSLAGEYRVCAEILKLGVFATVTYGNMKGTDIFAISKSRQVAVVEVKASNSSRIVTGFYQKYKSEIMEHPMFWVLYSLTEDSEGQQKERFFVLSHNEMAEVQARRNHANELPPYEERVLRASKGVDNVLIKHVEQYENAWEKMQEWCNKTV
jgi:hypothetical protein